MGMVRWLWVFYCCLEEECEWTEKHRYDVIDF